MIYIGIDISKISTAICIDNNGVIKLYSYSTKNANNKWIKKLLNLINFRFIKYHYNNEDNYSDMEIKKLNEFNNITDLIIDDILKNVNNDNIKIGIEGYSYNSKGPIFDLIEFSTILKYKLSKKLNSDNIEIISPLTLKVETCKMVYEPRIEVIGKKIKKEKLHYENTYGKKATKFDKWDMFYCLINSKMILELKNWCVNNKTDLIKIKEVPKPLDDIVDSIFIKEFIKNKYEHG